MIHVSDLTDMLTTMIHVSDLTDTLTTSKMTAYSSVSDPCVTYCKLSIFQIKNLKDLLSEFISYVLPATNNCYIFILISATQEGLGYVGSVINCHKNIKSTCPNLSTSSVIKMTELIYYGLM